MRLFHNTIAGLNSREVWTRSAENPQCNGSNLIYPCMFLEQGLWIHYSYFIPGDLQWEWLRPVGSKTWSCKAGWLTVCTMIPLILKCFYMYWITCCIWQYDFCGFILDSVVDIRINHRRWWSLVASPSVNSQILEELMTKLFCRSWA